jgi:hypothetical protein
MSTNQNNYWKLFHSGSLHWETSNPAEQLVKHCLEDLQRTNDPNHGWQDHHCPWQQLYHIELTEMCEIFGNMLCNSDPEGDVPKV